MPYNLHRINIQKVCSVSDKTNFSKMTVLSTNSNKFSCKRPNLLPPLIFGLALRYALRWNANIRTIPKFTLAELQLGARPLMKRTPDVFYRYHFYNYSFAISDMQIKYDHLFESVTVIFQIRIIDIIIKRWTEFVIVIFI